MKTKQIALYIFISLLFFSNNGFSQKLNGDYAQFLKETQQNSEDPSRSDFVWWIPVEFWRLTLQQNDDFTQDQIDILANMMSKYTIFAVTEGQWSEKNGTKYASYEDLKSTIQLVCQDTIHLVPFDEKNLEPPVQTLLASFQPLLKNMAGKSGENLHFFVFNGTDVSGNRTADPYSKTRVHLSLNKKDFYWKTPLGSIAPLKICPQDGEKLNGSWDFCPYHGVKLIAQ